MKEWSSLFITLNSKLFKMLRLPKLLPHQWGARSLFLTSSISTAWRPTGSWEIEKHLIKCFNLSNKLQRMRKPLVYQLVKSFQFSNKHKNYSQPRYWSYKPLQQVLWHRGVLSILNRGRNLSIWWMLWVQRTIWLSLFEIRSKTGKLRILKIMSSCLNW